MTPYVVKNKEFLEFFCNLSPRGQRKLIPILARDQLNTISEICKNFLRRNLTEDRDIIKKLNRLKKKLNLSL